MEASRVTRRYHTHGISPSFGDFHGLYKQHIPDFKMDGVVIPHRYSFPMGVHMGEMNRSFNFLGLGEIEPEPPIVLPERKYDKMDGYQITGIHFDEAQYLVNKDFDHKTEFIQPMPENFSMPSFAGQLLDKAKATLDASKKDMVKEGLIPDQSIPLTRRERRQKARKKK
jgi:hypothetical protein